MSARTHAQSASAPPADAFPCGEDPSPAQMGSPDLGLVDCLGCLRELARRAGSPPAMLRMEVFSEDLTTKLMDHAFLVANRFEWRGVESVLLRVGRIVVGPVGGA